ncbi:MAG: damage-inducible protein DinB [Acidobacteriota bacterium]|nr:damage-inducible protein DinB [Acidobacteriota bacterium]
MKLTDLFLGQLESEAAGTRRALERVPEGRNDWKPHEKSMPLGYLAALVASMPSWIAMMVNLDEMDIASPEGAQFKPKEVKTSRELVQSFDQSLASAREALKNASDEHLMKPWKFIVSGHVASEQPRYVMIRDSVLSHMAHHRGQLTVYLRLCGASVPAIYGPSADEGGFS